MAFLFINVAINTWHEKESIYFNQVYNYNSKIRAAITQSLRNKSEYKRQNNKGICSASATAVHRKANKDKNWKESKNSGRTFTAW